jgi:type II secretory pathway pseudopilin PulG
MRGAHDKSTRAAGAARAASRRASSRVRGQAGFTLIETLIAALLLVVGIATFFNALNLSVHAEASTRQREGATNLAREILEDARTIPYAQLAPTDIVTELQAMPGLANAGTKGWTIARRGYTYTVTTTECAVDDPKDGYGAHDSTFCAESLAHAASSPADPQPADLKRISVDITWVALGRKPAVHQVETLTAAGQSVGLSASELRLISPVVAKKTEPVITKSPVPPELEFAVTAPAGTAAMDWSLEGVRQSPQPVLKAASTTEWVFKWKIPFPEVSDGTYSVTAQAIDSTGVDGPPVSISVTLLRGAPAAPKGFVAGFNTIYEAGSPNQVIELQWLASPERNVIGYRVYHVLGSGGRTRICPASETTLSLALSCIDKSPPKSSSPNLEYEVVALYHEHEPEPKEEIIGEKIGEGTAAKYNVAKGEPVQPSAPTKLEATKNEDASVTLKWPKVAGASFYRVYRGSTNYTSRYAVVGQPGASEANAEFLDTNATTVNSYWVTTVSATLTESPFLGPVAK